MMWIDYSVEQAGTSFTIKGDWPGEVMGLDKDGNLIDGKHCLYRPGDIFRVNESGWLQKISDTEKFTVYKEEVNK